MADKRRYKGFDYRARDPEPEKPALRRGDRGRFAPQSQENEGEGSVAEGQGDYTAPYGERWLE